MAPPQDSPLAPYRPEIDGPFGAHEANHLLRRAEWGGTRARRDELLALGPERAAQDVTTLAPPEGAFADELALLSTLDETDDEATARGAWIARMLRDPRPLRERLTLVWHDHFATSLEKVGRVPLMSRQVATLRRLGPGPFGELTRAVCRDPAMVVWLDGNSNRRHHPNENFARELLELFTLGEGHYTERDVLEAARAFTGWHTQGGRFRFVAAEHDDGPKSVLGRSGELDGDDVVAACLDRDDCAEHVGAAIFAAFVRPDPEPALRRELGAAFREEGMATLPFVRRLLASRAFYAPEARRALVRSPVALAVGAARTLGVAVDARQLGELLVSMGQRLFAPPSVKGWEGGLAWLNAATLVARANLAVELGYSAGMPASGARHDDDLDVDDLRAELLDLWCDDVVPTWVVERLAEDARTRPAVIAGALSLPEAQFA